MRQSKLGNAATCLATEIEHDLQVYLVRRWLVLRRPAFVKYLDKILCYVEAERIVPALRKPFVELASVIRVSEFRIQLAIAHQAAERQIAGTHQRHNRVGSVIRAMCKIELCMKWVAKVKLHSNLAIC